MCHTAGWCGDCCDRSFGAVSLRKGLVLISRERLRVPFLGAVSVGSPRRRDRVGRVDMCHGPHPPPDRRASGSVKVKDFPRALMDGETAPRAFLLGQGSCKRSCLSYKTSLQSPPQRLWSALRFQASGFPYRSSLMVVQGGPVSWVSTLFPLFGISP